jgi:hypothetical protein
MNQAMRIFDPHFCRLSESSAFYVVKAIPRLFRKFSPRRGRGAGAQDERSQSNCHHIEDELASLRGRFRILNLPGIYRTALPICIPWGAHEMRLT